MAQRTRESKRAKKSRKPAKSVAPDEGADRIYAFADSLEGETRRGDADEAPKQLEAWVTFGIERERFALPVTAVVEILRVTMITRIPHAPHSVRGIVNMRGRVIPVVDLRERMGYPVQNTTKKSRILVTLARGRTIGLLVDRVDHVWQLDRLQVTDPPGDVMTSQSEYIIGMYRREDALLILLDPESVVSVPVAEAS